jgi:hypothetical protein
MVAGDLSLELGNLGFAQLALFVDVALFPAD